MKLKLAAACLLPPVEHWPNSSHSNGSVDDVGVPSNQPTASIRSSSKTHVSIALTDDD